MIAVHRRAGSRGSVSVAASGVAAASIPRTRSGARAASVASGGWPGAASVGVEVGVDWLPMSSLPSRARPPSGGSQTAPPLPERQRAPAAEPGHCRRILYRSCLDPEYPGRLAGCVGRCGRGRGLIGDSTPLDVRVVLDDGTTDQVELTWMIDVATRTIAAGCCARPPRQRAVFVATSGCPLPRNRGFDPSSSPVGERSRRLGDRPRLCEVYPLGQTLADPPCPARTASSTFLPRSASTLCQYWKARSSTGSVTPLSRCPQMLPTSRARAASSSTSRTRVPAWPQSSSSACKM